MSDGTSLNVNVKTIGIWLGTAISLGVLLTYVSTAANTWLSTATNPIAGRLERLETKVTTAVQLLNEKMDAMRGAERARVDAIVSSERQLRVRQWDRYEKMNTILLQMQEQLTTLRGQTERHTQFQDRWYHEYRPLEQLARIEAKLMSFEERYEHAMPAGWRTTIVPNERGS